MAAGGSFAWGSAPITIPATTAPGTYYIGILVDYAGQVCETNETNNYVSTRITVTAACTTSDLVITSGNPTLSPASVQVPALGGKHVLRVDVAAALGAKLGGILRRLQWRSVVVSNNGMQLQTLDNNGQSTVTVIIAQSAVQTRFEARIGIQVLDPTGGGWVDAGAEARVGQARRAAGGS